MIENNKLFFKTYDAFNAALESDQINDSAIVFIKDKKLIWTHGVFFDGGTDRKLYSSELDNDLPFLTPYNIDELMNYATKEELQEAVGSITGIDADTLLIIQQLKEALEEGEDDNSLDVLLQQISTKADKSELNAYLTKEEYDNITNPMRVTVSVSKSLVECDGNDHIITITYAATRKNASVTPDSVTITVNGVQIQPVEGTYNTSVRNAGTYNVAIVATYNGSTVSASTSITVIKPTYMGFSLTDDTTVNLAQLNKYVIKSITTNKTLNNDTNGKYLWIVTPHNVTTVATDAGFTYTVDMVSLGTVDGLKYYRSALSVDVCNLTYYIKS